MWGKTMLLNPHKVVCKACKYNVDKWRITFSLIHFAVNICSEHPSPSPSVFLGKIKEAFDRDADLQNLLLDSFFSQAVQDCQV